LAVDRSSAAGCSRPEARPDQACSRTWPASAAPGVSESAMVCSVGCSRHGRATLRGRPIVLVTLDTPGRPLPCGGPGKASPG
jgi:hypothetical protein